MDEIFGEDNFVTTIKWLNHEGGGGSDSSHFRIKDEQIIVFSTSKNDLTVKGLPISNHERYKKTDEYEKTRGKYYNQKLGMGSIQYSNSLVYAISAPDGSDIYPQDNNKGKQACWRWKKSKVEWGIKNGFIEILKDSNNTWTVYTKQYMFCDNEGNPIERENRPSNIIETYITKAQSTTQASKQLKELFEDTEVFKYSKPIDLIQHLIDRVENKNAIILDCFAGSGTTGHAVMKLNAEDGGQRQYICVQLPEKLDPKNKNQATACDFLDGIAKPRTIAEITKERLRRAGAKIRQEHPLFHGDLGFKVFKLADSTIAPKHSTYTRRTDFENEARTVATQNEERLLYSTQTDPYAIAWEVAIKHGYELTEDLRPLALGNLTGYAIFPLKPEERRALHQPKLLVIPTGVLNGKEDIWAFTRDLQGAFPSHHFVLWEGLFQGNDSFKRSVVDAIEAFKNQLTDVKGKPAHTEQLRIEVIRL